MPAGIIWFAVIAASCLLIIIVIVSMYNRLVTLRNRYLNAYSQIDVQLKRRYDLIPNLVEAVKGYMAHERQTLEAVIAARNAAVIANEKAAANPSNAAAIRQVAGAEGALAGLLGRIFVLSENYPDLKANQSFARLMEELTSTENRVAFARQAYNDSVMHYNTAIATFPRNLVAGGFGFRPAALFEIHKPAEREAVVVSMK